MYRVGIIGFGRMGKRHLDCYRKISGVEVSGVYDIDTAKTREYGVRFYDHYDRLIEDSDIISICTPTDTHKDLILKCLSAKKHVFAEKPLCRNLKEADEIMKEVKKSGLKMMVGHLVRYFNQYSAIKKVLDSGSIGKPAVARVVRSSKFRKASNNWFNSYTKSGGVILDLMIHDIDFLEWCFGDVERVYAKNLRGQNVQNLDYALAILRFKKGMIAHLEASWAHPGGFRNSLEIAGTKGILSHDSRYPSALMSEFPSGDVHRENPVEEDANLLLLKDFIDLVKHNKRPKVTLEDAYKSLKISLACLESVETGKAVTIK